MKYLIILIAAMLTACTTIQPQVITKTIKPNPEIMKDCDNFIIPQKGTLGEFMIITIENKKLFELCKNQNNSKKKFIEKITN